MVAKKISRKKKKKIRNEAEKACPEQQQRIQNNLESSPCESNNDLTALETDTIQADEKDDLTDSEPELESATQKSWKAEIVLLIILAAFTAVIYSNTLDAPFYLDDYSNIGHQNLKLTDLSYKKLYKAAFEGTARTRPIANLSLALNYYIHQSDLAGYHFVNILVHIITGLILFYFIKNLFVAALPSSPIHEIRLTAFIGALVWLVHPIQIQAVTYIVQRMTSMAAMLFILSLLLYIKGRISDNIKNKIALFSGSAIAGLLALGCKEIAATLPLFILLFEWFFFQDLQVGWIKKNLGKAITVVVVLAVLFLMYMGTNPVERILAGYDGREYTVWERVLTQFRVVAFYISQLLFPHPSRLNLEHDFIISTSLFNPLTTVASLAFLIMLSGFAVYLIKRERLISFCIIWFLGNLLIESSIISLEIIFEHRLYLPSMMALLLPVLLVKRFIENNYVKFGICVIVISLLSFWSYQRNGVWSDKVVFYEDSAKKSPNKARVFLDYGVSLKDAGMLDEAQQALLKAITLEKDSPVALTDEVYPNSLYNLAKVYYLQGKIDEAVTFFKETLDLNPHHVDAHIDLAIAYENKWQFKNAIWHYREALRFKPASDIRKRLNKAVLMKDLMEKRRQKK